MSNMCVLSDNIVVILLIFFKKKFSKVLSGISSECQTVCMQIGPALYPNCLQMVSANDTYRQRDKILTWLFY